MILTLSRNISNPDLSCDEFGSRPKESDSRVGPKYADSTRGLSSMIRDSKIFRALNPTRYSGSKRTHSDSTRGHPNKHTKIVKSTYMINTAPDGWIVL